MLGLIIYCILDLIQKRKKKDKKKELQVVNPKLKNKVEEMEEEEIKALE